MSRNAPSIQSAGDRLGRPLVEVSSARAASRTVAGAGEAACGARAVPRTVGNRRRDGCQLPSGQRICGPRARSAGARRRTRRGLPQPRARNRVRVRVQHVLARGRRDPEVDVRRERQRPRVLEDADAVGYRARGSRDVGDHDHLVDLRERAPGASARARVRGRERRRPPRPSCLEYLLVDRERSLGGRAPAEGTARSSPAATRRSRPRIASRIPSASRPSSTNTAASPASSRRRGIGHGDDRRSRRHRLEHGKTEALVPGGLHETGGSSVEIGEPLGGHVAQRAALRVAELGGERGSFSGPTTTSGIRAAAAASSARADSCGARQLPP